MADRKYTTSKKININFQIKDGKPISLLSLLKTWPLLIPSQIVPFKPNDGEFSTYNGFLPDLTNVRKDYEAHIDPVLSHIRKVWASDNKLLYDYILDYFAFIVQTGKKTESILIFNGDEGCGKSLIMDWIIDKIFGNLALTMTGCEKLTRNFNSHLSGKLLVCLEEMMGSGDRQSQKVDLNRIKHLCTSTKMDSERKGIDLSIEENAISIVGFSNYDNPLPPVVGLNRRMVQARVSSIFKGNQSYFNKLGNFLEKDVEAPACFLKLLMTRVVSLNSIRFKKPESEEKNYNRYMALHDVVKACYWIVHNKTEMWDTAKDIKDIVKLVDPSNKFDHSIIGIGRKLGTMGLKDKKVNGIKQVLINRKSSGIEDSLMGVFTDVMGWTGANEDQENCCLDDIDGVNVYD